MITGKAATCGEPSDASIDSFRRGIGGSTHGKGEWTRRRDHAFAHGRPAVFSLGCVRRQDAGVFLVDGLPRRCEDLSGQRGFQFAHRPGEAHGQVWAQRSSGSGLGTGPSFASLFRAYPPQAGSSRRQWRSRRLPRTCFDRLFRKRMLGRVPSAPPGTLRCRRFPACQAHGVIAVTPHGPPAACRQTRAGSALRHGLETLPCRSPARQVSGAGEVVWLQGPLRCMIK